MGRERKAGPGAPAGNHAKDRHRRDRRGNLLDWTAPLPPGLVARPEQPKLSSKHKSYFEFIENKDKKKKLDFKVTTDHHPPPGFEFVPVGNPTLTTTCKELSRERGAMIFIVTLGHGRNSNLNLHINRVGYHFRETIVEEAKTSLGGCEDVIMTANSGLPEPIPERQEDINKQADAAIRDLFPRIPNTDRQMIIDHAFNKSKLHVNGEAPVGLAPDITLSRRVHLAVLAHIRHTHTRYDQLLRETTYVNARKAVEPLCLDYLVKWRGDEETGRDQLDEILCEVVVISDSESEDDDDGSEDQSSDTSDTGDTEAPRPVNNSELVAATYHREESRPRATHAGRKAKLARKDRRAAQRAERGLNHYQVAQAAWNQALERNRQRVHEHAPAFTGLSSDGPANQGLQPRQAMDYDSIQPAFGDISVQEKPQQHALQASHAWPVAGPRPVLLTDTVAEIARNPGLDMKDYPVRSIEPYSPEWHQFPSQFSGQPHNLQNRGPVLPIQQTPAKPAAYPEHRTVHPNDRDLITGYRGYEEQGFINLSPRYETGRVAAAPLPQGTVFPVSSCPRPTGTENCPANTLVSHAQHRAVYHSNPTMHHDRPVPRSESRPIWIDDGAEDLRTVSRPIWVSDGASDPRTASRPIWIDDGAIDRRAQSKPVWVEDDRPHRPESYVVLNRMPSVPRQVQRDEYATLQAARVASDPEPLGPIYVGRGGAVVARVEDNPVEYGTRSDNHVTGYRQERVVGVEYVPVSPIRESRVYFEQQPVPRYKPEEVAYRPYQQPAIYPDAEYRADPNRPPIRRDDVVTFVDRRY